MAGGKAAKARSILAKSDEIFVKHAEHWARYFESFWSISQNPVFVWLALQLLNDPRRPAQVLPEWIRGYFYRSADNLLSAIFGLEPDKVLQLLGQAIGLSAHGRSIIADALNLLNAPLFVGMYEDLCKRAPVSQRAQWARAELRKIYGLQSEEAVRQRLGESRATARALLRAQGQVDDDDDVDSACHKIMIMWAAFSGVVQGAELPELTPDELRADFGRPIPRRAALRARRERPTKKGV